MENEFSRKHNFKNPEDCGLARHLGLPYQDERLYYSECYHTLVSLYDAHHDAVSELEHACERFNQAVIDMHSYDISLIGTAEQLRELIDKLERCYKSIIEFQNSKDKESESK